MKVLEVAWGVVCEVNGGSDMYAERERKGRWRILHKPRLQWRTHRVIEQSELYADYSTTCEDKEAFLENRLWMEGISRRKNT